MWVRQRIRQFLRREDGAVLALILVLVPLLILIGGFATDISQMNAQRRYVQGQADLAAQGAALLLPDPVAARQTAKRIVLANQRYGAITLSDADIQLGSFDPNSGFTPAADQANPVPATAVRVRVRSPFSPLLLAPVMAQKDLVIRRSAVGAQKGVAVFTLRNTLLGVNTRTSILNGLLDPLGIGVSTFALGYQGLANARVKVDELLGLARVGLAAETLTFNDVLQLPVAVPQLLGGLVTTGALPPQVLNSAGLPTGVVTLNEVLAMSPGLARLSAGDVLPDVSLSALDLLTGLAALKARPDQRLGVSTGLDLMPLAGVGLEIGLIRPPVTVVARAGDLPTPKAKVAQTDVLLKASVAGLLTVEAHVQLAAAEATLVSLNCAAKGANDVVATFNVSTAPATLAIKIGLLDTRPGIAPRSLPVVPVAGFTKPVSVTRANLGKPVAVPNPISLSSTVLGVQGAMTGLRDDLKAMQNSCSGPLAFLLCPLLSLVFGTVELLTKTVSDLLTGLSALIAQVGLADQIIGALLDLLGIRLAQAEVILSDYTCQGGLAQ